MSYKKLFLNSLLIGIIILIVSCNKDSDKQDNLSKTDKTGENSNSINTDSSFKTKTEKTVSSSDDFIIDYNISGSITGNMSIYRSGNQFKQVISTVILGAASGSAIYIKDNNVYSFTEIGGKTFGKKVSLSEYNKTKQTGETIIDVNEFQRFLSSKKLKGNENIIGHECYIYETAPDMTISVYDKKYVLKIQNPQFTAIATGLEMNPSFKSNEFELPKTVNFNPDSSKNTNKKGIDSIMKELKK
ncbi:MAG TPA: hypothetical protein PKD83_13230 [Ignavibacteria bacterium]|nr:hypothetical protein [Ignavibacteria bacterium]